VKDGVTAGDNKKYTIQVIPKDSQSSPERAAQVAKELINASSIDMMLASSTPEVVNPVSDRARPPACRACRPALPWQAWYFGRGAKEDDKAAYKYTYHFSFGVGARPASTCSTCATC
jgi:branched-chain amino acid transport system substrate-binding protein